MEETAPLLARKVGNINDDDSSVLFPGESGTPPPVEAPSEQKNLSWIRRLFSADSGKFVAVVGFAVLFGSADSVLFKMFTNKIVNYLYFFHQIFCLLFVVIFMPIAYLRYFFTDNVTTQTFAVPKWKFALMGGLDVIATIMMMFGGAKTAGPLQTLMRQLPLLFTLAITALFFKVRYHWLHYIGAGVILIGIALTVIMDFIHGGEVTYAIGAILFGLSAIPITLSNLYKEKILGETHADLYYLNGWVSSFQFLFGVILWPLAMPLQSMPFEETFMNIKEGVQCWLYGIDSLPGDECTGHLWIVLLYFGIAIINNIFILLVLTHGSAANLWIASAMSVPLSNLAFMLPFLVGTLVVPFDPYNIVGMVLVFVGMIVFNKAPQPEGPPEPEHPTDIVTSSPSKETVPSHPHVDRAL